MLKPTGSLKQSNVHKTLNVTLRLVIIGFSLGFIFWKIFAHGNYHELKTSVTSFSNRTDFLPGLLLLFSLMFVNWSVEAIKWQRLVSRIEKLPFLQSFQSVITGVTVSIFTPNRTGEFIGRAFILKKSVPLQAVLLTLVGSLSQLLVTLMLGFIALAVYYRELFSIRASLPEWTHIGFITGITAAIAVMIAFYLGIPGFSSLLERNLLKRFQRFATHFRALESISRKELIYLFLLSMGRYLIFSFQFYLVLRIFGIGLPIQAALYLIPLIYLALALIPTFALTELGVRGSVTIFLVGSYLTRERGFSLSEAESLSTVFAAGTLWLINLAIPALMGIPFVFKLRFFGK